MLVLLALHDIEEAIDKAAVSLGLFRDVLAGYYADKSRGASGGGCGGACLLELQLGVPSNVCISIEGGDDAASDSGSVHLGRTLAV